jgi:tetratricopeptide (TPR) repeat protein
MDRGVMMELQQVIKQQSDDLREELAELSRWEEEIAKKEAAEKKRILREEASDLPPIRGTVPTLKRNTSTKPTHDPIDVAKEQGNEYFRLGKIDDAIRMYTKGIDIDPESAATHVLYGNRAMCYLKKEEWEKAEKDATVCVQMNRGYAKGFYRRAMARKNLKKLKEARSDLETVMALARGDKVAEEELNTVTRMIREEEAKREASVAPVRRKRLVISEVEDESDEPQLHLAAGAQVETEQERTERNARIERDLQHLREHQKNSDASRLEAIAVEEKAREKTRRTSQKVEIVEDEESPPNRHVDPTPQAAAGTSINKSKAPEPTPRRNLSQVWTKDTLKPPKTFIEFERVYNDVRTNAELFCHFLTLMPTASIKSVFGSNLTPEILVDILSALDRLNGRSAKEFLLGLAAVPRLDELVMFFSAEEKQLIHNVLKLVETSGATAQEMTKIKSVLTGSFP